MKRLWRVLGTASFWLSWPALRLYLHWTRRTRVLIVCGDEVLVLQKWLYVREWSLPGGGMHRSEDPLQGALREVREETGIELQPPQLSELLRERFYDKGLSFDCYYFVCRLSQKPALKLHSSEILAVQWMSIFEPITMNTNKDVRRAISAWRS
jgi:8-oxo-dGTP pyrophosphatase MutT (NUDIX family)